MTPKELLYQYYTICFTYETRREPKEIEEITYDEMREYIHDYILNHEDAFLHLFPLSLFKWLVRCYENDEYTLDYINDINDFQYASIILSEPQEFDAMAITFIKSFFENIDIDFALHQYELLSFITGLISIYKVITYENAKSLCEEHFSGMLIALNFDDCIQALLNHDRITLKPIINNDFYLIDKEDLDFSDIIFNYYEDEPFESYNYSKDYIITLGNKDYFNLNDEAKKAKEFIDEYLDTSHFFDDMPTEFVESLSEHQVNVFIEARHNATAQQLSKLAHAYFHIEDILYNILPSEENDMAFEAAQIITDFVNTLPVASMGGIPYGEVFKNEESPIYPSYNLSDKDAKDFTNILSLICSNTYQADPTLYDDFELENLNYELIDPILYVPLNFIINNHDFLHNFVDNNIYMSEQRKEDVLEFNNGLIDWCMFLGLSEEYIYFVDQQGNKYATKILDDNIIRYAFTTRKKYIYIPLALFNYHDQLVCVNLCNDLYEYQVPNKIQTAFRKLRSTTNLSFNDPDDLNYNI